jgi:Ala-tRNA(Pro) deacylase
MFNADSLLAFLTAEGIGYNRYHHEPVMKAHEFDPVIDALPGVNVRNLFVYDKKRRYWLITLPLLAPAVDLKTLGIQLRAQGRLSFCSAEVLMEKLGVTPGSVCPWAILNNKDQDVTLVFDEATLVGPFLNAHPLVNTQTIAVAPEDLLRLVQEKGHRLTTMPLPYSAAA